MREPCAYMKQAVTRDYDFHKMAEMVRTRIEVFPDIPEMLDFFEKVPEYDSSMYVHKKMKSTLETSLTVLRETLPILEAQEDYSNDGLFAVLSAYASEKGYKTGLGYVAPADRPFRQTDYTRRRHPDHGSAGKGRTPSAGSGQPLRN